MLQFVVKTHGVAGHQPATSWVHYTTSCNTQSSALEDGQNNRPKHVELFGIINKPLLLHLVGCVYYLYHYAYSFLIPPPQKKNYIVTVIFHKPHLSKNTYIQKELPTKI